MPKGESPILPIINSGFYPNNLIDRNGRLYPIEIKATSTVMPGHTESLTKWRELAGNMAEGGLIIADIMDPFEIKGCHAVSWETVLDLT